MADGTAQPGSLSRRYDVVTGGEGTRRALVLVKRYYQMNREEWEHTSWADQRMYLEGLYFMGVLEGDPPDWDAGATADTGGLSKGDQITNMLVGAQVTDLTVPGEERTGPE